MSTHTYAVLEVSLQTYAEINDLLIAANYAQATKHGSDGRVVIDMHGIALAINMKQLDDTMVAALGKAANVQSIPKSSPNFIADESTATCSNSDESFTAIPYYSIPKEVEHLHLDTATLDAQIAELLALVPGLANLCKSFAENGFSQEEAYKIALVVLLHGKIITENFIGQMCRGIKVSVDKTLPPLKPVPVSEESTMQDYLSSHPCECGGKRELTGEAMYTDPIIYAYQCATCSKEGTVGYSDLRRTSIEDRPSDA